MLKVLSFSFLLTLSFICHAFGEPQEAIQVQLSMSSCEINYWGDLNCPNGFGRVYNRISGCLRKIESKSVFSSKWQAGQESTFTIINGESLSSLVGKEIYDHDLYYGVSDWYSNKTGNNYAITIDKNDLNNFFENVEFKMGKNIYKFSSSMNKCGLPEN